VRGGPRSRRGQLADVSDPEAAPAERAAPLFGDGPLFAPVPPPRRVPLIAPVVWVPDDAPPQVSLAEVGLERVLLCEAVGGDLPDPVWFTNRPGPRTGARAARLEAVHMVRLPADSAVFGGGAFVVGCGRYFLREQLPPVGRGGGFALEAMAPFTLPVVEVERDVLLVARFGIERWDIWLTELLPKIVLAEEVFPGRFAYLLPEQVLSPSPRSTLLLDSLRACGVDETRIFAALAQVNYRFSALYAVSPIWSDGMMHPLAAEALRRRFVAVDPAAHPRLAVAIEESGLSNAAEIATVLGERDFTSVAMERLPLAHQVAAFKGAGTVFAMASEGLANIVFCPQGVRVIVVAADMADARRAQVLERNGRLADLCCETSGEDEAGAWLDPAVLRGALETLP
jgi:hypothetical protein